LLHDLYIAKAELDGEIMPSAPLLRIISMIEIERSNLMYALSRSSLGDAMSNPKAVQVWDYSKVYGGVDLPTSVDWSELEQRLWTQYYEDNHSVADIARVENLNEATVYAILDNVKSRLLQHLAEHGDDQLAH
jgi:hypothetical protein